jgi:LL-diaminopimelate aminotransferase
LRKAGLWVFETSYTFYVWVKTPQGMKSADFASKLLNEIGVVATPGNGFGPSGEGYVRFALVEEIPRLEEAAQRIAKLNL